MTIVTAVTTATDTSDYQVESASSEASELQEQFLELLLVQLENQDPLDPVDTESFTSQLCSLSQLEQAAITNEYLENLDTSLSNSQAVSYIGKSVNVEGDTFSVSEGSANNISFELAEDASEVYITAYDEEGNAVWSEELSDVSSGTYSLSLDDIDDLEDGDYTFAVEAYDSDGDSVSATTYTSVEVTGVTYEDGEAYLVTDGQNISMDDVTGVYKS